MRTTIRLTAALLLAAAAALPASAQREHTRHVERGETRIVHDDGTRRLEVRLRGGVELTEEGDWVASVPEGALLVVEERGGGVDRRIEFLPRGAVAYAVGGRERPLDDAGRAWARGQLLRASRESGLGAGARVARIRARRGVAGVLAEIREIESDVGRRAHYTALFAGAPLSAAEFARVTEDVGGRMRSDVERRLVLVAAAGEADDGRRLAALLGATHGFRSDVERRLVLARVARSPRLAESAPREAFFRSVDGMRSDVERRLVLAQALHPEAPEAVVLAALESAGGMRSDVERRLVLAAVPAPRLRTPRVAAAYRRAVDGMRSEVERSLALRRLPEPRR